MGSDQETDWERSVAELADNIDRLAATKPGVGASAPAGSEAVHPSEKERRAAAAYRREAKALLRDGMPAIGESPIEESEYRASMMAQLRELARALRTARTRRRTP